MFGDSLLFDNIKDSEGWTAIHRCAAYGTAEDIYFLHSTGAPAYTDRYVTNWGWSPIHVAALMNNVSTLEALMKMQANQRTHGVPREDLSCLNYADFHGWTPLHLAVHRCAMDTMKWLLRKGADPHRRTFCTAGWFPAGHEGDTFSATNLALLSESSCLEAFLETVREMGNDITADEEDIYWDPN